MNISEIFETRTALEQKRAQLSDDDYTAGIVGLDNFLENATPRDLHEVRLTLECVAERIEEEYPGVAALLLRSASKVHGHMLGRP